MQKDFSYPLKIEDLTQNMQHYHIKASQKELGILKEILKVEDVYSFEADFDLKMNFKEHRLDIKGEVKALLVLESVISLVNFEKAYNVPFEYHYDTALNYQQWQELNEDILSDAPDRIENGQIDLVQIAIEQLSLAMDDYPKIEGETFQGYSEFDGQNDEENHPFGVLQKLKNQKA